MAEEEPLLPQAPEAPPDPPSAPWRVGAAFWLLGLCNNLPYVLMLSGARDILQPLPHPEEVTPNRTRHDCDPLGTGAVLLADVLPALAVKLLLPFVGEGLPEGLRVCLVSLCSWGSVALVASAKGPMAGLGGVAVGSAGAGLGEVTFLSRAANQHSSALSHWASGTGGAGVGGALWVWGMGAVLPLPLALLPALALPPIMAASYFFLLGPSPPAPPPAEPPPLPPPGGGQEERWGVVKAALRQGAPLGVVYFAEYFVNQGLLELLYFPSSPLPHSAQYRTLQLCYQLGVFVSRSSSRWVRLRHIWALAALQVLNAAFLLAAVAFPLLPSVGVASALVLWEGLVGGGAYANTFLNLEGQVPPAGRALAVALVTLLDEVAVAAAGGVALGAHWGFCRADL